MSLETSVRVLNQMVEAGVVSDYVIGGAMGALFYTEPFETSDLDIFVAFPDDVAIITLDPILDYLTARGYSFDKEHIVVEGLPLQVLPIYNELTAEAASEAVTKTVGDQTVRVMTPEHLLAIMVSLGRSKDKIRIPLMLSQAGVDMDRFRKIVKRHGLSEKWKKLKP